MFIDNNGTSADVILGAHNGSSSEEVDYSSDAFGDTWMQSSGQIGDLDLSSAAFDPKIGFGMVFGATNALEGGTAVNIGANAAELGRSYIGQSDAVLVPQGPNGSLQTASAVSDTAAGVSIVHAWEGGTATATKGVGWGYYAGPALKGLADSQVIGDVGTSGNWRVGSLADGGYRIALAGGPSGIFLGEQPAAGSSGYGLGVRAFVGGASGFSSATGIDCGDTANSSSGIQGDDMFEDPVTGALEAVYIEGDYGGEQVRYTELSDGKQSPPVTIAAPAASAELTDPSVASDGSRHQGLATWISSASPDDVVQATWLPAAALTGCAKPAPQTQTRSTTAGGQQITLTSPPATTCTASTGLSVTLTSRQLKTAGPSKLKFANAQFFIDKGVAHKKKVKVKVKGKKGKTKTITKIVYGPNKTAKKLPATESFSIKGLKTGAHTLTVKVHFKETKTKSVGHGKHKHKVKTTITITKKLKAKFKVC